jgi:alpha-N-arabinofuranosidase
MERLLIEADRGRHRISRHLYGHFSEHLGSCIYGGLYVGEHSRIPNRDGIRLDVVEALKRLKIPNLRWPGGCFADEYHWMDGIGPRERRPTIVNTHWGGVTENNHFGTHEFLQLCDMLSSEPYICGNVGSGTVREMSQWVEYLNCDGRSPMTELREKNGREKPWGVKYWAVGNEAWGCGGNMRPEHYADVYRRYQTYCRVYGQNRLFKVACGAAEADYAWTEVLMRNCIDARQAADAFMNGLSFHYYTVPTGNWPNKGSATRFGAEEWYACFQRTLLMEEYLTRHSTIMDRYDPEKKIALVVDEWGTWHNAEPGTNPGFLYQQNTLRDALAASINFDIFHAHADRVRMANIAQMVNVLQAVILTKEEEMILTPTFHAFEMSTVHHDALNLPVSLQSAAMEVNGRPVPFLSASASRDNTGKLHVSLTNIDAEAAREVSIEVRGSPIGKASGRLLTAPAINTHNTFEDPEAVKPRDFRDFKTLGSTVMTVECPARSFIVLEIV